MFRGSIVVSIPACHAGDRGSIPRHGVLFYQLSLRGRPGFDSSPQSSFFLSVTHAVISHYTNPHDYTHKYLNFKLFTM